MEDLFSQGLTRRDVHSNEMAALLAKPGYAFGMFRELDVAFADLNIERSKKFLLLRDPRDMVVSLFFAMAGAHRVPESGTARDEILRIRKLTDQQ